MASASPRFPLPIQKALERLDSFMVSPQTRYGRSDRTRAMRPERRGCLKKVLAFLIKHASIADNGLLIRVLPDQKTAAALTVPYIAGEVGLPQRNVERCLHDLVHLGYMESSKQPKRMHDGCFEVGPVFRKLTSLFWMAIGLWELFKSSLKQAKEHFLLKYTWTRTGKAKTKVNNQKFSATENERKEKNRLFVEADNCFTSKNKLCNGGNKICCGICQTVVIPMNNK